MARPGLVLIALGLLLALSSLLFFSGAFFSLMGANASRLTAEAWQRAYQVGGGMAGIGLALVLTGLFVRPRARATKER